MFSFYTVHPHFHWELCVHCSFNLIDFIFPTFSSAEKNKGAATQSKENHEQGCIQLWGWQKIASFNS